MVMPSTPGAPLLDRTRFHASFRLAGSATSSINLSVVLGLSGFASSRLGTTFPCRPGSASPTSPGGRRPLSGSSCRFASTAMRSYLPVSFHAAACAATPFAPSLQSVSTPSPLLRALLTSRRGSSPLAAASARACAQATTRSPQISPTTFPARSPTLRFPALISMEFAVFCPLLHPGRLSSRFLFIDPRFRYTLLSDGNLTVPPLRFATLRPDQAGRETFILIAMWHAGHKKKPSSRRKTACPSREPVSRPFCTVSSLIGPESPTRRDSPDSASRSARPTPSPWPKPRSSGHKCRHPSDRR